jgi:hypothetical protein
LRLSWVRARALTRALLSRSLAPRAAAIRHRVVSLALRKRRRTTVSADAERGQTEGRSLARTVAIAVLMTGAAALGVYAMWPSPDPALSPHRPVTAAPTVPLEQAQGAAEEPIEVMDLRGSVSSTAPAAPSSAKAAKTASNARTKDAPVPSAGSVPKGSPFAVDVRDKAAAEPAAPKVSKAMRFGAAEVPASAQRFVLRMSKPITAIDGMADVGGFTVVIHGALSLDRAGPIGAAHRSVARAMILNKGDRAELTVRFTDGKRPRYQVRADGSSVAIAIEGT